MGQDVRGTISRVQFPYRTIQYVQLLTVSAQYTLYVRHACVLACSPTQFFPNPSALDGQTANRGLSSGLEVVLSLGLCGARDQCASSAW